MLVCRINVLISTWLIFVQYNVHGLQSTVLQSRLFLHRVTVLQSTYRHHGTDSNTKIYILIMLRLILGSSFSIYFLSRSPFCIFCYRNLLHSAKISRGNFFFGKIVHHIGTELLYSYFNTTKENVLKTRFNGIFYLAVWRRLLNKGTTTISKQLILIKLQNNNFYCFANCPIIH